MTTINPYLLFNGNAGEAFNFYKSVFGGDFSFLQYFKDMPEADKVPENERDKILHVALPLGNGIILMGSDTSESMGRKVNIGNNIAISVSTESEDETTRLFNGLSSGGNIIMPLAKTFWNAFYGMFTDKFGIPWMISYEYK
jgi:PhnB protein